MRKVIIAGVALLAFSGSAAANASDYPPAPDPNTKIVTQVLEPQSAAAADYTLPRTGSDPTDPLLVAAAALTAGAGLVVISYRRRPART